MDETQNKKKSRSPSSWAVMILIFIFVFTIVFYFFDKSQQKQPVSTVAPTQAAIPNPYVDPSTVDVNTIKPANMTLDKKLFIDFDGDGQKEIVLIGKDNNHLVGGQVGSQAMPLIEVYQFQGASQHWNSISEVNNGDFPQNTNYSSVNRTVILSLGKYDGLVLVYSVDGSRINERFIAILGNVNGAKKYDFPDGQYKEKGGNTPHRIDVTSDGKITVEEGLYKSEDSNNDPTNGYMSTTYQVDNMGIHFQSTDKFSPPMKLIIQ